MDSNTRPSVTATFEENGTVAIIGHGNIAPIQMLMAAAYLTRAANQMLDAMDAQAAMRQAEVQGVIDQLRKGH